MDERTFETRHQVLAGDARDMSGIADGSIACVVTSPPYPMIEMWDGIFSRMDPSIAGDLGSGNGDAAFQGMHRILDGAWKEVHRVLSPGGFACINIGDATRSIGERFRLFGNHARIHTAFQGLGFDMLPGILWRKPTNAPTKFMGSGTLPAGAYVTLEHEHILVYRKGAPRWFDDAGRARRAESAFFWEERNQWFSDVWDFTGTRQRTPDRDLDRRSAAYPIGLPLRLINMYSLLGDTVLDPFLGTGTTSAAALACGRNSIGYETEPGFRAASLDRLRTCAPAIRDTSRQRLDAHLAFVRRRHDEKRPLPHLSTHYGFPVMTRQETEIRLREPVRLADAAADTVVWEHAQAPAPAMDALPATTRLSLAR